jgi:hypothetical protein
LEGNLMKINGQYNLFVKAIAWSKCLFHQWL